MAFDQGTTSSRTLLFDRTGAVLAVAQRELTQHYPRPGWVEHDPEEIWQTQLATAREALRKAGKDGFVLVILSLVMTLLAAPIEGFFSFDPRVPDWAKIAVGAVTLFGWLVFFRLYGRDKSSLEGAESPSR